MLGLALSLACLSPTAAWAGAAEEYAVKAAFLYNFGRFVEWPAKADLDPSRPFVIAVVGSDPFGGALDGLEGKTVQGRKVSVKRFPGSNAPEGCDVLFVSASERDQLAGLLAAAHRRNTLTVGDLPGFTRRGGVVEFVKVDDKVRFKINAGAAAQAGLRMSSQLLKLAMQEEQGR